MVTTPAAEILNTSEVIWRTRFPSAKYAQYLRLRRSGVDRPRRTGSAGCHGGLRGYDGVGYAYCFQFSNRQLGAGLTLGPAAGDVVVTATIAGGKLPAVRFTVTASASALIIDARPLAFAYNLGDPPLAAQTLAIGASGGGVVPFSAVAAVTGDVQWLQIDTAGGSRPVSIQVSVVNLDMLAPGVYQGSITVTWPLTNSAQSVAVQLTIADPNAGVPALRSRV